jgi:hypothetical protein
MPSRPIAIRIGDDAAEAHAKPLSFPNITGMSALAPLLGA